MNMLLYDRLISRVTEPDDRENALLSGYICVKSAGKRGVFIEGHRGLLSFSDSETLFSGKEFSLRVKGKGLKIGALSRERASVSGEIEALLFERADK